MAELTESRKKRIAAAAAAFGSRVGDYQPKVVTPVVRQELEDGSWRVISGTFPPTLIAEGVTEAEAIEIQDDKRAELGQLLSSG